MAITLYASAQELDTQPTDPNPLDLKWHIEVSDDGVIWEKAAITDNYDEAIELLGKKAKRYLVILMSQPKGVNGLEI